MVSWINAQVWLPLAASWLIGEAMVLAGKPTTCIGAVELGMSSLPN